MRTIFKAFMEFVAILLLFWIFDLEACGILVPMRIKPLPPALQGEALNTGPPGTAFNSLFKT